MTIQFYDDAKQKHQSIEAWFLIDGIEVHQVVGDLDFLGNKGYGYNEEQAQEDLINSTKNLINEMEQITAKLKEQVKLYDKTIRDDGISRNG
jgi:hypothetical protein